MCGRYLFSDAEAEDIREIIRDVEGRFGPGSVKTGEIYPSDRVPVLLGEGERLRPELFAWGFPGRDGKGLVINARAESVREKPMFRQSLLARRCVIPCAGFFEWTHPDGGKKNRVPEDPDQIGLEGVAAPRRQKYLFRLPGEKALYMAGLYGEFPGIGGRTERRFVILTTDANASVADVHSRMPLILRRELLGGWFSQDGRAAELLGQSPRLERTIA